MEIRDEGGGDHVRHGFLITLQLQILHSTRQLCASDGSAGKLVPCCGFRVASPFGLWRKRASMCRLNVTSPKCTD